MTKSVLIRTDKDADYFIKTHKENPTYLVFDTETTGTNAFKNSVPFSWQFAIPTPNGLELFYFNLHHYWGEHHQRTPPDLFQKCMNVVKCSKETTLIAHNIKFDLHHAAAALGVEFDCILWDTMVVARHIKNNLPRYSLDFLSKQYLPKEFNKDDEVKKWLSKSANKASSHTCEKGKKQLKYNPLYSCVPFDIMYKYAIQDVVTTWHLFLAQWNEINSYEDSEPEYRKSLIKNISMEQKYTKVLYKMEKRGVLVDVDYLNSAIEYEEKIIEESKKRYEELTGESFLDSDKRLVELYKNIYGIDLPLGEPSKKLKIRKPKTDEETLSSFDVELSKIIIAIRKHSKRLETYYLNIRKNIDKNNVLHPNFNQTGATSFRMSSSGGINFQNLPAREQGDEKYPLRGCFIPRKGYKLCSIDYDAQEVKLILDQSGELEAIAEILAGKDSHQANADIAGCSRTQAKIVIFSILYGSGDQNLADGLCVSLEEARKIKNKILSGLEKLKVWSDNKKRMAEEYGVCHNHEGGRYHFDNTDKFYTAVNYIIQGGSAMITKKGALEVQKLIDNDEKFKDVHQLIAIHDEIIFEIPEIFTEDDMIPIADAMCRGYEPVNGLPMSAKPEIFEFRWRKS